MQTPTSLPAAQLALGLRDVAALGQVFTPEPVVRAMLALRDAVRADILAHCGEDDATRR